MLSLSWTGESQERKTFLKDPVTRNITHLFYFAWVATTGINNIPMKETTFWTLSDLNISVRVNIGPCLVLNVTRIFVSIRFEGFSVLFFFSHTHCGYDTVMPHYNRFKHSGYAWLDHFSTMLFRNEQQLPGQWNRIPFVIKPGRKWDNFLPGQLSHSSLIWKWELFEVAVLPVQNDTFHQPIIGKYGNLTFPIAAYVWTGVRIIREGCVIPTDQSPVSTRVTFSLL